MKLIKILMALITTASTMQATQKLLPKKSIVDFLSHALLKTNLVFTSGNKPIAGIPIIIAKKISPVFAQQLEGPMESDRYTIAVDNEFSPKTIELFAEIALLHDKKEYREITKRLLAVKDTSILLELYIFLDKYLINTLIPLLAEPLVNEIAQSENLLNQEDFIFEDGPSLQTLVQALCEQQKVFFRKAELVPGSIISFGIRPDGPNVVIKLYDGSANVYAIPTKKVLGTIKHDGYSIDVATFSPDARSIATAFSDGTVNIYATDKLHDVIGTFKHSDLVLSVLYSLDSRYVLTTSLDGSVIIYDVEQKLVVDHIKHNKKIELALLSPNGRHVVTVCTDGIRIYDIAAHKVVQTMRNFGSVLAIMYNSDNHLLIASADAVRIYDIQKQHVVDSIKFAKRARSAYFGPSGDYVAIVFDDDTTAIYDMQKNNHIGTIKHTSAPKSLSFSPDKTHLAVTFYDGTVYMYDIQKNKVIAVFHHNNRKGLAEFSPDGKALVMVNRPLWYPITMCDLTDRHVIAISVLTQILDSMRLSRSSWLYTILMQLDEQEKNNLIERYPAIKKSISAIKQEDN